MANNVYGIDLGTNNIKIYNTITDVKRLNSTNGTSASFYKCR